MARQRALSLLLAAVLLACVAPDADAAICGNGRLNHGEGCDDGNTSPGDGCGPDCLAEVGWTCTRTDPSVCTNDEVCGNGDVEAGEACDDANITQGDGCSHECEVETGSSCTGEPSVCVPPGNLPVDCGDGVIDDDEECDDENVVAGDGCDEDCTIAPGYQCTGEPSVCTQTDCGNGTVDAGEDCDGGPCCVGCAFGTSTRTCRTSAGGCDAAETCSGTSADCPADTVQTSNTICRGSSGVCDAAERCDGTSSTCPTNVLSPSTTVCRPAVHPSCDVAETCTGSSTACPEDALLGCPDTGGSGCVEAACDPSGQCTTVDNCAVICRGPQFWATRATSGADATSAIELVLDEVGSIQVCGETIDNADDLGNLGSALEGLCVRPQGDQQRELYRALMTTALNCLLSEGDCDEILSRFTDVSFTDCDALCQAGTVPGGPTIDECIEQLECFNEGGQLIDGDCATGTCASDSQQLCGGDFGSCSGGSDNGDDVRFAAAGNGQNNKGKPQSGSPTNGKPDKGDNGNAGNGGNGDNDDADNDDGDGEEDECVAFDDNCADARLCGNSGAEVQLCGRRLVPRNQKLCKEARSNECTIGECN